jgi:RNA polymerase sigma-70 factor, ECF subfamily
MTVGQHAEGSRTDPLDGWVEGVRRGDREAVAAVYLEVAPALRGYLLRQVGHGEVADDLVEQAFVALLTSGAGVRGDGRSLRAWLYRTARHDLLDWRKRAERRSDHELTSERSASLASEELGPEDRMLAAMGDPGLVAALAALTDEQREVVELRIVAGLPLAEVAELTGRSVGAVKLLQHRGVRRLAELLGEGGAHA